MAWFDRQAAKIDLEFIRVSGVDGRHIAESTLKEYHTRCPPNRTISFGELGCFLSHVNVWKRIMESGQAWGFVAEDDFCFSPNAKPFLKSDDWLPPGMHLVKAETMLMKVRMSSIVSAAHFGHDLRLLHSFHGGTAGYFVSRQGASRLLEFTKRHCEPVDHFIFRPSNSPGHDLTVAQIDPAIGVQSDLLETAANLASDLDQDRKDFWSSHPLSRKPRGLRKAARELHRMVRRMFDPIQESILTAKGNDIFRKVPVEGPAGLQGTNS